MSKVIYRNLLIGEAEKFWKMMNELDNETKFMMYEPGERQKISRNTAPIENLIKNSIDGRDFLIVAEIDNEIIGYISAQRGVPNRIKHTAYIVTGIREGYRGRGIGTEFFKKLDLWAVDNGITRLELTVMCNNSIAKNLYEKNGFIVEGIKKNSMYVDDSYIDEYYMAKILKK